MSQDIHMLSGAYAVDALDPAERADFEAHLSGCSDCTAEVESLREAAHTLSEIAPLTPSSAVRERVLTSISQVRPLPPLRNDDISPASDTPTAPAPSAPSAPSARVIPLASARRSRLRRIGVSLVAAAAAVIAAISFWNPWGQDQPLTGVDRVMAAADAQQWVQTLPQGGKMTVYRSVTLDQAAIVAQGLPDPGPGKVYEIWLQNDEGAMIPAATLPSPEAASVVLVGSASAATAAGVTVEPAGGSPAPTTEPAMVFGFDEPSSEVG